jgi:hypothetical protein
MLSTHLRLVVPNCLYPTKTLYAPLLSPIRATRPAYPILLDLLTRIFGGITSYWTEYRTDVSVNY